MKFDFYLTLILKFLIATPWFSEKQLSSHFPNLDHVLRDLGDDVEIIFQYVVNIQIELQREKRISFVDFFLVKYIIKASDY